GTGSDPHAALPVRAVSDPTTPTIIAPTTTPAPAKPAPSSRSDGPRCRTCGNALAPGAAFCPNCGTPV
ncbi:MAG: zinc-ribbon domain-containing protein, partial [Chloroflexota bacterium]|nr:zinc-ribbon domain-containing protein [Chloroflexota bacterium]